MADDLLADLEELARKIVAIDLSHKKKCRYIVVTEVLSEVDPAIFQYLGNTRLISSTKVEDDE
jgi:hypothetical protein